MRTAAAVAARLNFHVGNTDLHRELAVSGEAICTLIDNWSGCLFSTALIGADSPSRR
jgi:hypothetical protein